MTSLQTETTLTPADQDAANRARLNIARNLRRWAELLRQNADDPDVYQQHLLHTIEVQPGLPVQKKYCAVGFLELANFPEGTPHGEIWEQAGSQKFGEKGNRVIYQPIGDGSEAYPSSASIEAMGLWPAANPFAARELELDEEDPNPATEPYSGSDLVYIPLDDIEDPDDILEADKGIAELDGEFYVSISALSDAGQKYWNDIAAFAERHADRIEAEARQNA